MTAARAVEVVGSLGESGYAEADAALAETDRLLVESYPGDTGARQPIHTVYVPGHLYRPGVAGEWGAAALDAVEASGGLRAVVYDLVGDAEADVSPAGPSGRASHPRRAPRPQEA